MQRRDLTGFVLRRVYRRRQAVMIVAPLTTAAAGATFGAQGELGLLEILFSGVLGAIAGVLAAVALDQMASRRRRAYVPVQARMRQAPIELREVPVDDSAHAPYRFEEILPSPAATAPVLGRASTTAPRRITSPATPTGTPPAPPLQIDLTDIRWMDPEGADRSGTPEPQHVAPSWIRPRRLGNGATSLPLSPSIARHLGPAATPAARSDRKRRPATAAGASATDTFRPATRTRAARSRRVDA